MADPAHCPPLTRDSVIAAHGLIKQHIHLTPVLTNQTLNNLASTPQATEALKGTPWEGQTPAKPQIRIWFKCENQQRIGAFKARGAFHAIIRLMAEEGFDKEKGVVTHSSGNHAQALSFAARTMNLPAYIVMPTISMPSKIAATRSYGAQITFSGSTSIEREAVVASIMAETGARLVPPYDHPDIMLGQGTLGLEMQEQVREQLAMIGGGEKAGKGLDAIITPCGGGGMLSGTALSCEGTGIAVFGAEPEFEGADDCKRGLETGTRIERVATLTVADGLRTPVGKWPWTVIHDRKLVKGAFSVSEGMIVSAMRLVFERVKLVVEPSACVGLAVALYNEDFRRLVEREAAGGTYELGVVLSGGNVSVEALGRLFAKSEEGSTGG